MEKITINIEPKIIEVLTSLIDAKKKFNKYLKEQRITESVNFEIGEFNQDIDACINTVVDISSISANKAILKELDFEPS